MQWNKVVGFSNFILEYVKGEISVNASAGNQRTHRIPGLTSGTKFDSILFTVFENVRSSRVRYTLQSLIKCFSAEMVLRHDPRQRSVKISN